MCDICLASFYICWGIVSQDRSVSARVLFDKERFRVCVFFEITSVSARFFFTLGVSICFADQERLSPRFLGDKERLNLRSFISKMSPRAFLWRSRASPRIFFDIESVSARFCC